MHHDRREFLGRLAAGAMLGAMPLCVDAVSAFASPIEEGRAEDWDLRWTERIKGKYRAVFDVTENESGYGVWRASLWARQYQEVLGVKPQDLSTVVVLRHNAIALAMSQAFWDKYGIGKLKNVNHPITEQPTDRNPVLLASSRNEVPAEWDDVALDKLLARGGIVLACNLALAEMVGIIAKSDSVAKDEARKQAIGYLVPGVILQPSGVFAAVRAQDAGCKYLLAS